MAFTNRIKCVMLLLAVAWPRHSYTQRNVLRKIFANNELQTQDGIGVNTQNSGKSEQLLDLQFIFGTDWKSENIPINKDKLNSIFKDFKPNYNKEFESSTQGHIKSNADNIAAIFGSPSNAKYQNGQFDETYLDHNSKVNLQESEDGYGQDFDTQTVFPINIGFFPDSQKDVTRKNSSQMPVTQTMSSVEPINSSSELKTEADVYLTSTPKYYDSQGNPNPTTLWPAVDSDINSINPHYAHKEIRTTSPSSIREIQSTTKSINWFSNQDGINSTSHSFWPENQKDIDSTYVNFSSNNESDVNPVRSDPHVDRQTNKPENPIRPNFGYSNQGDIRPIIPHYWPFSQAGINRTISGFTPDGPNNNKNNGSIQVSTNLSPSDDQSGKEAHPVFSLGSPEPSDTISSYFRPDYQRGIYHNNFNVIPHSYHHHWNGAGRNFPRGYHGNSPGFRWFNSQSKYDQHPYRFGKQNFFHHHNHRGWFGPRHGYRNNRYNHQHRYHSGIHHSHGL